MKTKYLPTVERADFDDQIDEVLEKTSFDGGGESMVIAIENRGGQVYRVLETTGIGEFMNTVFGLLDLGFVDLLQDKPTSKQGYDSLLRPTNIPVEVVENKLADWSDTELQSAVDAYLWMLTQETEGKPYSKADVNRQLREAFLTQGKNFTEELLTQIKFAVGNAVAKAPKSALNEHKRNSVDAVVAARWFTSASNRRRSVCVMFPRS